MTILGRPGHVASAVCAMRAFHVLKYFQGVEEIVGSILHGSQALWLVGELMVRLNSPSLLGRNLPRLTVLNFGSILAQILSFIVCATLGRELFGAF